MKDPEIGIDVQVDSLKGQAILYEVTLTLTVTAKHDAKILWLAELSYVDLFKIPEGDGREPKKIAGFGENQAMILIKII